MRRASDLLGLPVFDSSRDCQIGTVKEILVDLLRGRLVALLMPEKVWAEPGLIPVDYASSIGPDQVRLAEAGMVCRGEQGAKFRQGKLTLEQVRKLAIFTRSGSRLGNVEDLILDDDRILALELSDGLIQDVFQGRDTLALPPEARLEEKSIIVPDNTQCNPQEQPLEGRRPH
jgi:uncharacterized protein YrrD